MKIFLFIAVIIVLLPVIGLAILSWTAKMPQNLGVHNGKLAACPESPNCVSSQAEPGDKKHAIEPFPLLDGSVEASRDRLKQVIGELSRATIVEQRDDYVHVEVASMLFRFVDDLEFYIDVENSVVQVRSASRVGQSDLGVNRDRVETLRKAYLASP